MFRCVKMYTEKKVKGVLGLGEKLSRWRWNSLNVDKVMNRTKVFYRKMVLRLYIRAKMKASETCNEDVIHIIKL